MTAVVHAGRPRRHCFAGSLVSVLITLSGLVAFAAAEARLDGVVRDPQGRPVAGATVLLVGPTIAPESVRTDDSGRFSMPRLGEGRYDITASAPGLVGEARGVVVSAATPTSVEIGLRVSAISETLVVSASQVDQPLSRTADSVTIVGAEEISRRQLTVLGDALSLIPGLTVARNGGPGALTSLFPRGGDSDYTLILVDGIRANAFGGGIDLSQLPLQDVERIEVVRGPQSALYGSDAIGGVVQIITRTGGAPSVQGGIEGGSRNTRRMAVSTTGQLQAWSWQAGGNYFADDGFTGVAPASGEQVSNDDARENQSWVGTGWRAARGTDLQGIFRYVDTSRGAPGPYGSDPAGRFGGVDRLARGETTRTTAGLRIVHPWTGPSSRVRQRIELDTADYDLSFLSAFGLSESETRRVHGRVQTDAVLGAGLSMSGGVEWLGERARNTFITAGPDVVPVERRVVGVFGEGRWNARERATLQLGIRGEQVRREALGGNPSPFSPRPEFAAESITSINPKVSAAWLVSPGLPGQGARAWTRLRAAAGTGIRPPDAFEIAFTDNPVLKPERSRSVEAGVTQALAGGGLHLDATAFVNHYDDLIISVGRLSTASRYLTDNISNARARGLEVGAAWRGRAGIDLHAAYTFLDTEIRAVDGNRTQAPPPYRVGDALLRRPRHAGSLHIGWTDARLTTFATLATRGVTLDAEPAYGPSGGLYENPGRVVVDAGGSFRLARGVQMYARVLNLFNRDYEEVLGYPAPGRTAFAGVRLAAGR